MPISTHPPATFKAFIYGEFLRIARNTSEKDEYIKSAMLFTDRLLKRGYQKKFIADIYKTVSHANRQRILEQTGKKPPKNENQNPLVFTTTYTGYNQPKNIKTALRKHWHLISNNAELKNTFNTPPIIAFKRSKNLQDDITTSKFPDDGNLAILLDLADN